MTTGGDNESTREATYEVPKRGLVRRAAASAGSVARGTADMAGDALSAVADFAFLEAVADVAGNVVDAIADALGDL